MSGKLVRAIMVAVLLALVMTVSSPVLGGSSPAQVAAPAAPLAMELGTTAS